MKIKDINYYSVSGWMRTRLHLNKTKLPLFAIIYGFSQGDSNGFNGSLQYLQDWTDAGRSTVIRLLGEMVDHGLIIKTIIKGHPNYKSNNSLIDNILSTPSQNGTRPKTRPTPSQNETLTRPKTRPNTKEIYIKEDIKTPNGDIPKSQGQIEMEKEEKRVLKLIGKIQFKILKNSGDLKFPHDAEIYELYLLHLECRKAKRVPHRTSASIKMQYNKLKKMTKAEAVESLETAIAGTYTTFYALKSFAKKASKVEQRKSARQENNRAQFRGVFGMDITDPRVTAEMLSMWKKSQTA